MAKQQRYYKKTRGDFLLTSKEADKSFTREDGAFALFWINSPVPHKTTRIEYIPNGNYPSLTFTVHANWKAAIDIRELEALGNWKKVKFW